jgi:ferric-dicitrate binding protein FerR (iron transport regulator)
MNDELIPHLRQHDPASGKALTGFDRTRILHRAQEAKRAPRRRWLASLALAAVVIFVAAIAILHREPPAPAAHVQTARQRQIQYATPGGTRIVWTLDPNFHM